MILEELSSDDRADIVAHLDTADTDAILAEATPETTESLRITSYNVCYTKLLRADTDAILAEATPETTESLLHLLQYPHDTAGGLMITEFVAVPASLTAQEVIV